MVVKPEWAEMFGLDQQRVAALPWQIPEEIRVAGKSLTVRELADRLDASVVLVRLVCDGLRAEGKLIKVGGY